MNRLDEAFGVFGWKREHTRDNKNCIISIWDAENKHWVSKEDTGTESNTEQAKGLASDSFKRAGFNIGIGRELYDYPVISIRLNDDEVTKVGDKYRQSYNLKLKDWTWESKFEDSKIVFLKATDDKGKGRYLWSIGNKAKPIQSKTESLLAMDAAALAGAIKFVAGGGDISKINTKYKMSKAQELQIKSAVKNG